MKDSSKKTTPRREFIKKSLIASGGVFTGLLVSDTITTQAMTVHASPMSAVSNGSPTGSDTATEA